MEAKIRELNNDPNVSGISIQLPLPKTMDAEPLFRIIDEHKAVEGFANSPFQNVFAGALLYYLKETDLARKFTTIMIQGSGSLLTSRFVHTLQRGGFKVEFAGRDQNLLQGSENLDFGADDIDDAGIKESIIQQHRKFIEDRLGAGDGSGLTSIEQESEGKRDYSRTLGLVIEDNAANMEHVVNCSLVINMSYEFPGRLPIPENPHPGTLSGLPILGAGLDQIIRNTQKAARRLSFSNGFGSEE